MERRSEGCFFLGDGGGNRFFLVAEQRDRKNGDWRGSKRRMSRGIVTQILNCTGREDWI